MSETRQKQEIKDLLEWLEDKRRCSKIWGMDEVPITWKVVEALKKGLSFHFDEEIIKIKTRNI